MAPQTEAWLSIMDILLYAAFGLVFITGWLLFEARRLIFVYPRAGIAVATAVVLGGFHLSAISGFHPDAQLVFSSAMMALGVSVMASIIISAPMTRQRKWLPPAWRPDAEARLQGLRDLIADVEARKMSEGHKKMKLQSLYDEFYSVIEAIKRLERRERERSRDEE